MQKRPIMQKEGSILGEFSKRCPLMVHESFVNQHYERKPVKTTWVFLGLQALK